MQGPLQSPNNFNSKKKKKNKIKTKTSWGYEDLELYKEFSHVYFPEEY